VKWATRKRCHVDRAACAWLIRRFIDPVPLRRRSRSGLDALIHGLSLVRDDPELIVLAEPLFDGLYEYRKQALLSGRRPA
jgi:hypothetical protein